MAEKKQTEKLGTVMQATHIVRPDGTELDVTGNEYVLDVPGVHVIDGVEVTAK